MILEASPYHGTLADREGRRILPDPVGEDGVALGLTGYFAPKGYAVVMMDLRGTGFSDGCLDHLGPDDAKDLHQVVEWAASQPWSTGRVGMTGHSYVGSTPTVAAASAFPAHAHQAIQISFLFEGRIRLRAHDDDPWTEYAIAIVPSQQRHGMDGAKVHYGATLFVEPETRAGRALTERYLAGGIAVIPDAVLAEVGPVLFAAWREAAFGSGERGCGGRIRTDDLRVMSPTSYHCSTPRSSMVAIGRAEVKRVRPIGGSSVSGTMPPEARHRRA